MNKQEFLAALHRRLSSIPMDERDRSLRFYAESIDDRVEDGMSEEQAVAALGDLEAIAREIETSLPLSTIVRSRARREREERRGRGHSVVWIVLAVLGCPIWLSLLAAVVSVVVGVAAALLAVYVALWAVVVAFVAGAIALGAVLVWSLVRALSIGVGTALLLLGACALLLGLGLVLVAPLCLLARAAGRGLARVIRWLKGLIWGKGASAA